MFARSVHLLAYWLARKCVLYIVKHSITIDEHRHGLLFSYHRSVVVLYREIIQRRYLWFSYTTVLRDMYSSLHGAHVWNSYDHYFHDTLVMYDFKILIWISLDIKFKQTC